MIRHGQVGDLSAGKMIPVVVGFPAGGGFDTDTDTPLDTILSFVTYLSHNMAVTAYILCPVMVAIERTA